MLRLFVGLSLPAEIRLRLMGVMGGVSGARWQTEDQLHLTLRFIGEVSEDRAEDIDSALDRLHFEPFDLTLRGLGTFGNDRKTRALWAGVSPEGPVADLAQKVEQAVVRTGLPPETRRYSPHITLARFRNGKVRLDRVMAAGGDLMSTPWTVDRFHLYRSHLAHTGAAYEILASYPDGPDGD
ncbi:MAG: RNA 2',3'-cyclic phosphodiesterase [Alphaproteobacteria bacterium]